MAGAPAEKLRTAVRGATVAHDGLAVAAALNSIDPGDLAEFFQLRLADHGLREQRGEGLPASPGAASGRIVLNADAAMAAADEGYVMCESFHDIWTELHEDLIVLQRVNRIEEDSF
jgi:hypothetical protein